jgi:hypothetical protein
MPFPDPPMWLVEECCLYLSIADPPEWKAHEWNPVQHQFLVRRAVLFRRAELGLTPATTAAAVAAAIEANGRRMSPRAEARGDADDLDLEMELD